MAVSYEWDYETLNENGDIEDHCFNDSLSSYSGNDKTNTLCLVCNEGNEKHGVTGRYWGYVVDGKLPECFSDSTGNTIGIAVPQRFHNELKKYLNKAI